jgi:hypothetical protein
MNSINVKNNSAQFYIDKINNKENFSFTRWGDGEWFCTMGVKGKNCDGHVYFPELSESLNIALKNDKGYYKAIWNVTHGQIANILNRILPFLDKENINYEWVNAGIWEDLVLKGGIENLVESLEKRNFIIVSNDSLKKLPFKYTDFVSVPSVNCFLEKERIKEEMIEMTEKYDDVVFGLSSSMTTNVIVDELYDIIGNKCTMIDFGSIWDPFVGNIKRSYHKKYEKTSLW